MIRDKIKSEEYFNEYISRELDEHDTLKNKISTGKVAEKAIPFAKYCIYTAKLNILIAKYSIGEDIQVLKQLFNELLDVWINGYLIDSLSTDSTYGPYSNSIIIFALCVLFDIDERQLDRVKNRLKEEKINDWLINFLLNKNDSIDEIAGKLYYPKTYGDLQAVILSTDNQKELLELYVTKLWYRKYRGCNFWGSHKKEGYFYRGYWTFESAAVATILNIDDSGLKDFKYYPYDLVHQN